MAFVRKGNVVSFSPSRPSEPSGKPSQSRLPRNVRRRRLIWLIVMIAFFGWFLSEFVTQTGRISAREAELKEKKAELTALKKEQKALREEIKRLHDEEYLKELARKYGYQEPGEEIYTLPEGKN
ncbi:cell division protein FtsB [Planifilum fimeticola]|jgi:cell division protein DivIC|uniref:Cell division protein FtsB n=1 Tax=Planifilum fimeticola TaxID=201975 RepID=A0A2T0LDG3_9BACL|nr:septum formation initiator family protein [Planifilum fimeticola]PRX39879.1 cell division protein FtsB [Planifilum fimeticola]